MAAKGQFTALVSVQDFATKALNSINRAGAALSATLQRVGLSGGKIGATQGIKNLGSGIGDLARQAKEAAIGLTRIVTPLGAITGAASLAGLYKLTTSFADMGNALRNNAAYVRMSVPAYQGLINAGRLAGVSADTMKSGIDNANDALHDMVGGRAPEAVAMVTKLRLAWRNMDGSARNVGDFLPELAEKLKGIQDPTIRAAIASRFLGGAARDMLPFLNLGAEGIEENTEAARKHGLSNEAAVASYAKLVKAQSGVEESVEGLGWAVSEKLAPVLVPMLTALSDYIDAHRKDISDFFGDIASRIQKWIDGGGITKTVDDLKAFGTRVDDIVQKFGGWKTAIEVVGSALTLNLLSPLTLVGLKLAEIAAFKIAPWALGLGGGLPAAIVLGGTAGFMAAKDSGDVIGMAAEMGMGASTRPFSTDDNGTVVQYEDKEGNTYSPDQIKDMYRARQALKPTIATAAQDETAKTLMQVLAGLGQTPSMQAAAAAAAKGESGLDPTNVNPNDNGSPSKGLFQWHADRIKRIEDHLGKPIERASVPEQAEAYNWELKKYYPKVYADMQRADSAMGAIYLQTKGYEVPANPDQQFSYRLPDANHFAEIASPTPPPLVPPSAPIPSPNPAPAQAAPPAPTEPVHVQMDINHHGANPGTTVTARAKGPISVRGTAPAFDYQFGY